MAVLLAVALTCDRCTAILPAPVPPLTSAGQIRDAAEQAGWQVVGNGGVRTDRCPTCRPQPATPTR